jgi:hypothetical protein
VFEGVMMLLKNIEAYAEECSSQDVEEKDLMTEMKYVSASCGLVTESLQRGCDVLHMPNGDIITTELKPTIFYYRWDDKTSKFIRHSDKRVRKTWTRKARQVAATTNEISEKIEELA